MKPLRIVSQHLPIPPNIVLSKICLGTCEISSVHHGPIASNTRASNIMFGGRGERPNEMVAKADILFTCEIDSVNSRSGPPIQNRNHLYFNALSSKCKAICTPPNYSNQCPLTSRALARLGQHAKHRIAYWSTYFRATAETTRRPHGDHTETTQRPHRDHW